MQPEQLCSLEVREWWCGEGTVAKLAPSELDEHRRVGRKMAPRTRGHVTTSQRDATGRGEGKSTEGPPLLGLLGSLEAHSYRKRVVWRSVLHVWSDAENRARLTRSCENLEQGLPGDSDSEVVGERQRVRAGRQTGVAER